MLLETECGSALERTFNKRVFNGVDAELGYWPWMAALIDKKDGHFCGGTLVKDQFILTAAHCVKYLRNFLNYGPEVNHFCT